MLNQFVEFVKKKKSVDYFAKGWYSITYVKELVTKCNIKNLL